MTLRGTNSDSHGRRRDSLTHGPQPVPASRLMRRQRLVPCVKRKKELVHKDVSAGRARHSRPTHAVRARPLRHASKKLSPLLTLLVPKYVLCQSGGNLGR